jgi:hypothetical protein
MADDIEVIPPSNVTNSPGNRTKASRLRKRVKEGETLTEPEAAWLEAYEDAQRRSELSPKARAAASSRKVSYTEEESHSAAETHGEGTVAFVQASAAMTREEGQRVDSLARIGIDALCKAFDRVLAVNQQLLDRNGALEDAHLQSLNAISATRVALTEAEIKAMEIEAEANQKEDAGGIEGIIKEALPTILAGLASRGVKLPTKGR